MKYSSKRGNVWLGVSGVVFDERGRLLVVKKKYSGLKGQWSFPAGFVNEGETADQAAVREVFEETGIQANVVGCLGVRTGVLRGSISDNMILFLLKTEENNITIQENEISAAQFIASEDLLIDKDSSLLVKHFANPSKLHILRGRFDQNPGDQFGYSAYHLFL